MKNYPFCPFNVLAKKVVSGLFCANLWPFWPNFLRYELQICLLKTYINFDIHTKFEVNQTQTGHSIPQKIQKLTKVAISQNPILHKCHSPKSLLLLHFLMNLSETFRINVKMNWRHINLNWLVIVGRYLQGFSHQQKTKWTDHEYHLPLHSS